MREIFQEIVDISTSSVETLPAMGTRSRKNFLGAQSRFSKHACSEMKNNCPFQYASCNCGAAIKSPLPSSTFELPREFPSRTESASADKFRSRSSYMAYVRDCERRHFARQLLHAQAHYGLRPRSGTSYPSLSHPPPHPSLSLSLSLAPVHPRHPRLALSG